MYWMCWPKLVLQTYPRVVRYLTTIGIAFGIKALYVVLGLKLTL